ncbi:ribosomal protein L4 (apicoplast) [Theileria orientalis]|uniref:Ribosomal protein L4 n=1 Tax=Theileria orientalis TaxID=68886 RepID=A0A976SI35_THEOR|nr:ribosomal protein L4 [Theileria orientalis]
MFNNNIINFLLFKIKFYLNIKHNLIYNFNIFISKHNKNTKIIFNYLKKIKNNMFNFRNKFNFNKSGRNLTSSKKKTGNSRLGSSSSSILKKGLLCVGLRNIKLKSNKYYNNLLKSVIVHKKNIIKIQTVEIIKFIYNTTPINTKNINNKTAYKNLNNIININSVNNYISILNQPHNINMFY